MSCDWPVDDTVLPELPAADDPGRPAALLVRQAAIDLATQVMWSLSGRRFGVCEFLVRPCMQNLDPRFVVGGPGITSYLLSWEGDRWLNWSCGCIGVCREAGPRAVHLPGPVQSVVEVKIADAVLPVEGYRLEGNTLYRVGANWPGQDLNRPAGEAGTWTVTYTRGEPVPAGVDRLTGILAAEMVKALSDPGKCRLPRNVTTTSRQGVTYQVYDPAVMYANGKTGLAEIDMWLAAVNPNHLMAPPTVT